MLYFRAMQMSKKNLFTVSAIILVAAVSRLLPHPMNFAPLGAMALFGSAYFGNKGFGLLITMISWLISDLILNNFVYNISGQFVLFTEGAIYIYGSIVLIYALGTRILKKITVGRMLGGSLAASIIFFLVSNFGVWVTYPSSYPNLMACYMAAIPFFKNTLAGDLFFSGVLFLLYERVFKSRLATDRINSTLKKINTK